MPTPLDLNSGVIIKWNTPLEIKQRNDIDLIKVFKSKKENYEYSLLASIPTTPNNIIEEYKDPEGRRDYFYLVTFNSTVNNYESSYHITYFYPLPSELRMITILKGMMPDVLKTNRFFNSLNDFDYLVGLKLALGYFNTYPPQTNFTLENFPKRYEFFLFGISLMFLIISKYLPISVKDWNYSEPGGVSMSIDRGSKFNTALEIINKSITSYLPLLKMDLASDFVAGAGTIPLPLSLGGVIPQGVMNVLDIFTAVGR